MRSDLIALAERCEAANGPDSELDQCIHELVKMGLQSTTDRAYPFAEKYTSSLDSALTLVPEGMAWRLYSDGPTYVASAEVGPHPKGGELMSACAVGEGETPALALTAASLRAIGAGDA